MVNPIASGVPASAAAVSAPLERPVSQPEPAVQVTGAAKAELGGDAAGHQPGNSAQPPENADALDKVNQAMQNWDTGLRFEMDEDAQRLVVSIVDNETGEVIRKVPSEAVLKVAKMIIQLQGGGVNTSA